MKKITIISAFLSIILASAPSFAADTTAPVTAKTEVVTAKKAMKAPKVTKKKVVAAKKSVKVATPTVK